MNPTQQFLAPPGRRQWLLLTGGLAFLFLFLLGTRGLNEPDEGRYANIAMAMARPGGDWWEPRMSGYGHYDKPPLIYWATALSFRAFGYSEWAARLPSLAGAVLALGGLGWTAYRLRGARVAWWSVLFCGTSAQFWAFGRILSPDMLLTGWCTLAIAAWAEARHSEEGTLAADVAGRETDDRERSKSWAWWLVSLGCWTLAWWTKATPALVPLAGLIAGNYVLRDRFGQRALRPWLLVPAILVLGSPWFLSMLRHYPDLRDFFFGRELLGRLTGRVAGRHGWPGYYIPISLVAWLPWWPVAAWAVWRTRARLFAVSSRAVVAAWTRRLGIEGWIVLVGLLILSLASSKLSSYTLTLAPWAALLMARALTGVAGSTEGRWRAIYLWPAGAFALLATTLIAVWPTRWESSLGVNSSLRQVSDYLRREGAGRVDSDRYWAGLEFYLGTETIHYVIRIDGSPRSDDDPDSSKVPLAAKVERYHERDSDHGVAPNRFVNPDQWPALPPDAISRPGNWWFIRFHRLDKPVFDQTLLVDDPARRPVKMTRIGDFDLYRMPDPR